MAVKLKGTVNCTEIQGTPRFNPLILKWRSRRFLPRLKFRADRNENQGDRVHLASEQVKSSRGLPSTRAVWLCTRAVQIFHGSTNSIQCSVNFLYILALESSFLHPIIVGSRPSNDKAVILIGQRYLLSGA